MERLKSSILKMLKQRVSRSHPSGLDHLARGILPSHFSCGTKVCGKTAQSRFNKSMSLLEDPERLPSNPSQLASSMLVLLGAL